MLKSVVPEFIWPTYVLIDNTPIKVRNEPYSFGVKKILVSGDYEVSERTLIKKILKVGDHVIEFGGSIGILAAIMSDTVSEQGMIVTVEAAERLSKHSKTWLEPKGNVKVENSIGFPVWQAPASYQHLNFIDDGNSLGGMVDFQSTTTKKESTCDIKTLSEKYHIVPNILVIDIEGSEIVYLEQEVTLPESIQYIVIEMHPNLYGDRKEKEIIVRLVQMGYELAEEINHVYLLSRINGPS